MRFPVGTGILRLSLAALAGWSVVGLLLVLFLGRQAMLDHSPAPWRGTMPPTLLYVGLWALLTPPLLAAAGVLRPRPPFLRAAAIARVLLLCALAGAAAFVHLVAYAALAIGWADAGSLANLPEPALFFAGRLPEGAVIAALLVGGEFVAARQRAQRRRELEAARLATQLSESRLQALAMELRPHFLFNTLNAISGLVWHDPAGADAMVVQLGELLRRTLEAGDAPVSTLAEERHVLELYLAIQRVRFGERLTVHVDLPDALLDAEVPRFLLQPLVENAFQHGLAPKRGPVSLIVEARVDGDRLTLRVRDDGVGLPAAGAIVESTGVGNTRRRLAALYGDAQSLTLESNVEGGTTAVVTLPRRRLSPPPPAGPITAAATG